MACKHDAQHAWKAQRLPYLKLSLATLLLNADAMQTCTAPKPRSLHVGFQLHPYKCARQAVHASENLKI